MAAATAKENSREAREDEDRCDLHGVGLHNGDWVICPDDLVTERYREFDCIVYHAEHFEKTESGKSNLDRNQDGTNEEGFEEEALDSWVLAGVTR